MKRRIVSLLLTLCVLGALLAGTCVLAAGPQLPSITDEAGLLTETQLQRLTQLAESVAQKYDFGVYVVTIDDYRVMILQTSHSGPAGRAGGALKPSSISQAGCLWI